MKRTFLTTALSAVILIAFSSTEKASAADASPPPLPAKHWEEFAQRLEEMERRLEAMERAPNKDDIDALFPSRGRRTGTGIDEFDREFRDLLRDFRKRSGRSPAVTRPADAFLGIEIRDLSPREASVLGLNWGEGIVVKEVMPGTSANKAGMLAGDVIVAINGTKVDASWELVEAVHSRKPGDTLTMTVVRNGQKHDISATLGTTEDIPDDYQRTPQLPQLGRPGLPQGGLWGRLQRNAPSPDEIPSIEVKVEKDAAAAVLAIRTNALALSDELLQLLKPTEVEERALEEALAAARNDVARRLTPMVSAALEGSGVMQFDSSGIEAAVSDALDALAEKLKTVLPENKLKIWRDYVHSHKYMSQSFSIRKSAVGLDGGDAGTGTPALTPPASVKTF